MQLLADLEEAEVAVVVGVDRAARHAAPHVLGDLRRAPSRAGDRGLRGAPSADALRRRALRARGRHRGGGLRPRRARRRHRQPESRRAPDRHDAHRVLRRAVLPRPLRRAAGAGGSRGARLPYLRIFADPQRLVVSRREWHASARCGSRARCTRTTAASTRRWRPRVLGIAREPDFIVGPDVRAGRLTPILRRFEPPPLNIYVVYPSRRHLSAKVRAFADFLVERFATPQWGLPASMCRRGRAGRLDHERRSTRASRLVACATQRRGQMTHPPTWHARRNPRPPRHAQGSSPTSRVRRDERDVGVAAAPGVRRVCPARDPRRSVREWQRRY